MMSAAVEPARRPVAVEAGTSEQYLPRWSFGAYSAKNTAAPEYSPAAENPWMLRKTTSRMGAAMPMVAYPGRQPIRKAAPVIRKMDMDSDHLRPFLSPMLPQNDAPSGRNTKDSANTAKESSVELTSDSGKNTMPMVMAK